MEEAVALWTACGLTRPWNDARRDFRTAMDTIGSTVLCAARGDIMLATAMVGFDGHRGWIYYLAVAPTERQKGLGRAMMEAAENWLIARKAPKLQLMVRNDNPAAVAFYESLGLERQAVVTLGKRLRPVPE
jgi:ribosomal protein S18 acetylase RimI-like enzyme